MSLPELLVTMMLMGLVATLVATLVVSVSRAFSDDRAANDSTNTAAIAMNEMTRVLRAGTPIRASGATMSRPVFLHGTATSVELHAFLDTDSANPRPVKIRFTVDGSGVLTERRFAANASSDPFWTFSGTETSRVIARDVVATTSSQPLFTYLGEDGIPITLTNGALTTAQLSTVTGVTVNIGVQSRPGSDVAPVRLINTVGIPNLSVSRLGL